jgi:hypothetical protein
MADAGDVSSSGLGTGYGTDIGGLGIGGFNGIGGYGGFTGLGGTPGAAPGSIGSVGPSTGPSSAANLGATLAGLALGPTAGLAAQGIASLSNVGQANAGLAAFGPPGTAQLGFTDYMSDLANGLTFGLVGTAAGQTAADNAYGTMSEAAQGMGPNAAGNMGLEGMGGYGSIGHSSDAAAAPSAPGASYGAFGDYGSPDGQGPAPGSNDLAVASNNPDAVTAAEMGNLGGDSGGGAGGAGSVICTQLFKQGLLPREVFRADQAYGAMLIRTRPEVMAGYHFWAMPIVRAMKRHRWIAKLAAPIVRPWAQHMAHEMGANCADNAFGRVLMSAFLPICGWIGRMLTRKPITQAMGKAKWMMFNSLRLSKT